MRSAKRFLWGLLMPLLFLSPVLAGEDEDQGVTARVARISVIEGDAQIKRGKNADWERAVSNLPLVEGDEITTTRETRLEIQFDRNTFVRLDENSYLKFTTLRDEGIALSLPEGTLSLRILNFNTSRQYFEIDAPQTTLSVEKAGLFRVESGDSNSESVRVAATEGGQARIYSDNSGFTLKNGRSAIFHITGNLSGEWETNSADRYADNFETWVLNRDAKISQRLRNANYDRFYDNDIYGAEDLNDYGEWVHTRSYGYIWRPYRTTTGLYSNWSPYRYGHWRWIPLFGWTWVNDEPWGWATYHHGRWVYFNGGWGWSPYGYYHGRRSWWRPALVVFASIGRNYCWYPLPYHYGYYNYNRGYYDRGNTTIINNNTTVIVNNPPAPGPTPRPTPPIVTNPERRPPSRLPIEMVPPGGVVTASKEDFGRMTKGNRTLPIESARKILARLPVESSDVPQLPVGLEKKTSVQTDILIDNQRIIKNETREKTGAMDRKIGVAMDQEIRKEKIYQGRLPIERPIEQTTNVESKKGLDEAETKSRRGTGAVERQNRPIVRGSDESGNQTPPIIDPSPRPTREKGEKSDESEPRNSPPIIDPSQRPPRDTGGKRDDNGNETRPVRRPRPKSDENQSPPIIAPPPQREERKYEPPQREEKPREQPRYEPPKREQPPRYEPPPKREQPPRYEPPPKPRAEPRNDPPKERPSPPSSETRREKPEKNE